MLVFAALLLFSFLRYSLSSCHIFTSRRLQSKSFVFAWTKRGAAKHSFYFQLTTKCKKKLRKWTRREMKQFCNNFFAGKWIYYDIMTLTIGASNRHSLKKKKQLKLVFLSTSVKDFLITVKVHKVYVILNQLLVLYLLKVKNPPRALLTLNNRSFYLLLFRRTDIFSC